MARGSQGELYDRAAWVCLVFFVCQRGFDSWGGHFVAGHDRPASHFFVGGVKLSFAQARLAQLYSQQADDDIRFARRNLRQG